MQLQALHAAFEKHANAADLDAIMAMYEPGAVFVLRDGATVNGVAAIRAHLGALMALKPRFQIKLLRVIEVGDLAVLISHWELAATAPDGSKIRDTGRTHDVVRRQRDGSWLFVVDSPYNAAG
jgi:uncharacterized protein (TIGR02246 family)